MNISNTTNSVSVEEALRIGKVFGGAFFGVNLALYSYILASAMPPIRQLSYHSRLNLVLNISKTGRAMEVYIAIASVVSCVLFVWDTYGTDNSPLWMFFVELFVSISFLFQYLVDLYAAHNRFAFLTSVQALVDKATVTPVLVSFFTGFYAGGSIGTTAFQFSRIMKFTRVLRLLRLFRSADTASSVTDDAIRHQLLLLSTTVTSILVITTGFVQYISNELVAEQWADHGEVCPSRRFTPEGACVMDFHDALYFTVITFTTVGYGDVAPGGTIGRLVILSIIAATFVLIPLETSKLLKLLRLRSSYAGGFRRSRDESFVVVAADRSCTGVGDFVQELYHTDHGSTSLRVCLLVPSEPSRAVKEVLLKHKQVTYLKGDAVATKDLLRAQITEADACFLLSDRFAKDPDKQDSTTVLRALNVKSASPDLSVFVQILQPENKVHCISAGIPPEHVVCAGEVKFGLIGNGCSLPGFSTLLVNLISSMSNMERLVAQPWHEEYAKGLEHEIYTVTLPRFYQGKYFSDVVWYIYANIGAMMFAVSNYNPETMQIEVQLNPGKEYVIRENQVAVVIARDIHCVDRIISVGQDLEQHEAKISPEKEAVAEPAQGNQRSLESSAIVRRKIMRASRKALATRRLKMKREKQDEGEDFLPKEIQHQEIDESSPLRSLVARSICVDNRTDSERFRLNEDSLSQEAGELLENLRLIQAEFYTNRNEEFIEDIGNALRMISGTSIPLNQSSNGKACKENKLKPFLLLSRFVTSTTENNNMFSIDGEQNLGENNDDFCEQVAKTAETLAQLESQAGGYQSIDMLSLRHQLSNHFVIICAIMDDLQYLVAPIRLRYPRRPIVVLCPKPPTRREWSLLVPFSRVYYLKGSRSVTDMKLAGIDQAMCAICLSQKPSESSGNNITRYFSSSDAEVILNVLDVECNPLIRCEGQPKIRTMCELNSNRYITGLGANHTNSKTGATSSEANFNILSADSYIFEPSYASGKVVAANFLESLLCQVYFNPCIIAVVNALVSVPHSDYSKFATIEDFEGGYMDMVRIPQEFYHKTYGEYLYHILFNQGVVPLGLYRYREEGENFVLTNPSKDTILYPQDQAYVIMSGAVSNSEE